MRPPPEAQRRSIAVILAAFLAAQFPSCKAPPSPTRFVEQQDAALEVVLAELGAFPDGPARIERALGSRYERVRKRAELARSRLQARGVISAGEAPAAAPPETSESQARLDSPDPLERQGAALALGRAGDVHTKSPAVVSELLEHLRTEKDERARWAIVWALGKLARDRLEVRAALAPLLGDPNRFTASFASCAIQGSPGFRIPEPIAKLDVGPDFELLRQILPPSLRNPKVELRIAGGEVLIELFAFEAPLHVMAFVKLVNAGGLAGKHAVQVDPCAGVLVSGSTTGTRLPDETWPRQCLRGCLVSPDGGPGTLFIATLPLPDADGRLTVWGRVSLGLEVVDRIREGDAIDGIRVLDSLGRPWPGGAPGPP